MSKTQAHRGGNGGVKPSISGDRFIILVPLLERCELRYLNSFEYMHPRGVTYSGEGKTRSLQAV